MNRMLIILKSGKEIHVDSEKTIEDAFKHINIEPGSCLMVGRSIILCTEIAAIMDMS